MKLKISLTEGSRTFDKYKQDVLGIMKKKYPKQYKQVQNSLDKYDDYTYEWYGEHYPYAYTAKLISQMVDQKVLESKLTEDQLAKSLLQKAGNNEIKFYDQLEQLHDKLGHPKYMKWLNSALKSYGVDIKTNPKIKTQPEAEEALYLLTK